MTPHQQALADAVSAIVAEAGQTCAFGAASFPLAFANLRPAHARLLGLTDRQVAAIAQASTLPNPAPTKGDLITVGGVEYRLARHDPSFAADKTLFVLSLP